MQLSLKQYIVDKFFVNPKYFETIPFEEDKR